MIKLILLTIVIILLFILIQVVIKINNKTKETKEEIVEDVVKYDEYELEKLANIEDNIEHFQQVDITKEDYEKIRNDEFNNQFFNFQSRLNGSSDNVDNSVERINRFRNSKFGLTPESSIGMRIRDVSDYFISK